MRNSKPILLVEDDRLDIAILQRALKERQISNPFVHFDDGKKGLDYLKDKQNTKPLMVFLDLNMPNFDGFDFLELLKSDKGLKKIPVIVLTASEDDGDISKCFNLGAAGYLVKPPDYGQFLKLVEVINKYWTLNRVPSGG
jgi:CheY-like chemotaxis protein